MANEQLEKLVSEFETAHRGQSKPCIQSIVDLNPSVAGLLEELAHTDLELHIKAGRTARVEQYLNRFPLLSEKPRTVRSLLKTEFNTRNRFESGLEFNEYVLRFPNDYSCLLQLASIADTETPQRKLHSSSARTSRFRKSKLYQQGGLGSVWHAYDQELSRPVALKEVKDRFADDEETRRRFINEARITGALEHPGIVPVYGTGTYQDGRPFYAMRMVEGRTLHSAIQEFHESESTEGAERTVVFGRLLQHFVDLCNAIQFAHDRGVIHRDIKPGNVMIGNHGETIVVDWGLAKIVDQEKNQIASECGESNERDQTVSDAMSEFDCETETKASTIMGSPAFMSPEQSSGEPVSYQADVYSLGATLFCIVTGIRHPRHFFETKAGSNLMKELQGKVSKRFYPLLSICQHAMNSTPSERYPSCRKLVQDIERFRVSEPVTAHEESFKERLTRTIRKHRGVANTAVAAVTLLALVSTVAAFAIQGALSRAKNDRDAAEVATDEMEDAKEASDLARDDAIMSQRLAETEKAKAEKYLCEMRIGFEVFSSLFSAIGECALKENDTLATALERLMTILYPELPPMLKARFRGVVAKHHHGAGRAKESLLEYSNAIEIATEAMGSEDPLTLEMKAGKAVLLQQTGQNIGVRKIAEPLLQSCLKDPEANKYTLFTVYAILATLEGADNSLEKRLQYATASYDHALKIYDNDPAEDHCLRLQSNRIALLRKMKKSDEALALCNESLAILSKLPSRNSIDSEALLLNERTRVRLDQAITRSRKRQDGLEIPTVRELKRDLDRACQLRVESYGRRHLYSRLGEIDMARLFFRHPNASLQNLEDAVKILEELQRVFAKEFPENANHIRQIRKDLAYAKRNLKRLRSK